MKSYKALLTIIFVTVVIVVRAQSVSVGAKGGLSLTRLSPESVSIPSSKDFWLRYHLGVFADFRFAKFSVQPEVLVMAYLVVLLQL